MCEVDVNRGAPLVHRWDPIAQVRAGRPAAFDVLLSGSVFFDIVFTDLPATPAPGTEVWAGGMGSSPGGVANLAVAAARLGLHTALAAAFGDDVYGAWCWEVLERDEGIDLSRSRRFPGTHSAVTVSIATGGDRAMVTHGHPAPVGVDELVGVPPTVRAAFAELALADAEPWWHRAADEGALVFADLGWDPTGAWDPAVLAGLGRCHAFLPNAAEAMAYTRRDTPIAAARALAERVPLAVVTCGADGVVAVESASGTEVQVPRVPVNAIDATGAGDVFGAALVVGTLAAWPLPDRLAFASLAAALAVQQFGGSLAAPGWGDIADWWHEARTGADADLVRRYEFLDGVLPSGPVDAVRRAEATLTASSHLPTTRSGTERRSPRRVLGSNPTTRQGEA